MSARIRFRGGPLAGRVFAFDDDKDLIVIGRDPERCDVVLPLDMTEVGREHLALRRSLGRYRLVLSPSHPVLLDGSPALNDQELPEHATLTLGREGPEMVVSTLGSETVPPTIETEEVGRDVPELVSDAVRRSRVNRQIVLFTAGVLGLLALVGFLAFRDTGKKVRSVTEEQARVRGMVEEERLTRAEVAEEQRAVNARLREQLQSVDESIGRIQPDLTGLRQAVAGLGPRMQGLEERIQRLGPQIREGLARAAPSVYLVMLQREEGPEDPVGTAWVAARGTLVTNAHVGALLEKVRENQEFSGARLVARSPGVGARDHVVTSVVPHPGWRVFSELWAEYRPTDVDISGHLSPLYTSGACDVALLEVTDPGALAPALEIAPQDDLERIAAGDVVGFVGYPAEDMASGGVNPAAPAPTIQVAHVTATTNYFLAPDEPPARLLVQHSLPATGGASGSPILDEHGRVIAVLNAGNVTIGGFGQRIPSAVLVNFAQRADLVRELLQGRADLVQGTRTERWRRDILAFTSLRAAVEQNALGYLKRYLSEVEKREGRAPERIEIRTGVLGTGQATSPPVVEAEVTLHLPESGVYVFFVYSSLGQSVGLRLVDAADPTRTLDRARADQWYAVLQVRADAESDVVAHVAGPVDTEYHLTVWHVRAAP